MVPGRFRGGEKSAEAVNRYIVAPAEYFWIELRKLQVKLGQGGFHMSKIADREIDAVPGVPSWAVEALVVVDSANVNTGKVRVRLGGIGRVGIGWIWRNNKPPINAAWTTIALQQFRRVPCHRMTAIRGGENFDPIVLPG